MHGFYYSSNRNLHNTILSPNTYLRNIVDQKAYKFIWSIYNEVAQENRIRLPTAWLSAPIYDKSDRKHSKTSGSYILEPLDFVFVADANFDFRNYAVNRQTYNVYIDINWRTRAESFFMIGNTAKNLMELDKLENIRPVLCCKRWRAISRLSA